jgi:hypothetical protein
MATLYETVDTLIKECLGDTDPSTGMYQLDEGGIQALVHKALHAQGGFIGEAVSFDWKEMVATFTIPDTATSRAGNHLIVYLG